jgi:hypothetical protein
VRFPERRLRDTVTLHRLRDVTETDRYGSQVRAETTEEDIPARVIALQGLENLDDREFVQGRYTVIVMPDVDVTAVDELTWNAQRMKVDGPPKIVGGDTPHHIEISAQVMSG